MGVLKTSGYALGFQHYPQDLANVNERKIMFASYSEIPIFFASYLFLKFLQG